MVKFSKNYEQIAELYKYFGSDGIGLDFSQEAKEHIFIYESRGIGHYKQKYNKTDLPESNGFYYGKRLFDITVALWNEQWNEFSPELKLPLAFSVWALFRPDPVTNYQIPHTILERIIPDWIKVRMKGNINPYYCDDGIIWLEQMIEVDRDTDWDFIRANLKQINQRNEKHYTENKGVRY